MKSMLYVGATLMIGASIYGFVDYQKTSHKKEFTNMYKEKTVNNPEKPLNKTIAIPNEKKDAITEKTDATVVPSTDKQETKTVKTKKRKFRISEFSRAPLDERYIKEEINLASPDTTTKSVKHEK